MQGLQIKDEAQHIGVLTELTNPSNDLPPEFIELENRAKSNGYSLLKQILVDYISVAVDAIGENKKLDYVLSITLPCGSVGYRTFDEIPETDVPCSCGNHWFIQYRDLRG